MTEKDKFDCTDCKHYGGCYLRQHKDNDEPCKDIELDEWVKGADEEKK